MPYGDQSEYLKFNQSCSCEDSASCSCGTSDTCGCPPVGTVEVKDECGKHVGFLTPSDAAQYNIDTLEVPEGYIKVFDPNYPDKFIGLLTPEEYQNFLQSTLNSFGSGINVVNTNVLQDSSLFEISSSSTGGTGTIDTLSIDRNGNFSAITLQLVNLPTGFTDTTVGGQVVIPASKSRIDIGTNFLTFSHTAIIAGTYNNYFQIQVSGVGFASFTIPINFISI